MQLFVKTNANVNEIYGKAPLNNSGGGGGGGFGDRHYQWSVNLLHSQSRAPSLLGPWGFSPA